MQTDRHSAVTPLLPRKFPVLFRSALAAVLVLAASAGVLAVRSHTPHSTSQALAVVAPTLALAVVAPTRG